MLASRTGTFGWRGGREGGNEEELPKSPSVGCIEHSASIFVVRAGLCMSIFKCLCAEGQSLIQRFSCGFSLGIRLHNIYRDILPLLLRPRQLFNPHLSSYSHPLLFPFTLLPKPHTD